MQIMRAIIPDHGTERPGDEHAGPIARVGAKHRPPVAGLLGLPAPHELPTCRQRRDQERGKAGHDQQPRQFHVAAGKIGEVGRSGPDDDDGGPVVHLMNGPVEALANEDDDERQREEW